VHIANRQLRGEFQQYNPELDSPSTGIRACKDLGLVTIAALHQGNYATIPNYLEKELRYMDAGERGPKAPELGQKRRRVTNSHVIYYCFGHRYAFAALDGADL
jgi:hypothetical protein